MLTPKILAKIMDSTETKIAPWTQPIINAMKEFGIDSPTEQASFLAQIGHESNHLNTFVENLNYSASGLAATWARFSTTGKRGGPPNQLALKLARNPVAIANNVYANRLGNGDEASGDGFNYRGRGPIQLTGKENYKVYGEKLGVDLIKNPTLLLTPEVGARSAGCYWKSKKLDLYDDDNDVKAESRIINGGDIGLPARQALFDKALPLILLS